VRPRADLTAGWRNVPIAEPTARFDACDSKRSLARSPWARNLGVQAQELTRFVRFARACVKPTVISADPTTRAELFHDSPEPYGTNRRHRFLSRGCWLRPRPFRTTGMRSRKPRRSSGTPPWHRTPGSLPCSTPVSRMQPTTTLTRPLARGCSRIARIESAADVVARRGKNASARFSSLRRARDPRRSQPGPRS